MSRSKFTTGLLLVALYLAIICISRGKGDSGGDMEVAESNYPGQLLDHLFASYSTYVRPVSKEDQILFIYYDMKISRILQIDERNQILSLAVWLEQRWQDDFLTWDPALFGNITEIHIPSPMIWLPDTVLYQTAETEKEPGTGIMKTNAIVNYTGGVFWPAPAIFRSSCKLDITYFPFDEQECVMTFGPWTYTGNFVQLKQVSDFGDISRLTPNGQWSMELVKTEEHLLYYGCCIYPFSDITYKLYINRKPLFYVFNMLIPSVFFSFFSLLVFYLPCESGEKLGLNIGVLLSLVFFLLLGAQLLPPTSDALSFFATFYTVVVVLIALETVCTVFILRLYHHDPEVPVPRLIREIFLHRIGGAFLSKYSCENIRSRNAAKCEETRSNGGLLDDLNINCNNKALGESLVKKLEISDEKNEKGEVIDEDIGSSLFKIGYCVQNLAIKSRRGEQDGAIKEEWVDLVYIFDRILLIIFAVVMIITLFIIFCRMIFHF